MPRPGSPPPRRRSPGGPALAVAVAALTALAGCAPLAWHAPGPVVLPWRLLAGVLLAEIVLLRRVRRLPRRRVLWAAALLAAGAAATFALRWALVPAAFFHQNGQGPLWAEYALCRSRTPYGPGYAELLGWLPTWAGGDPERAIFLFQALAAATIPVSAWILLRALRVRRALAWTAFAALAAAPSLARAGQSESYYTACAVGLFAAAAVLAVGASGRRRLDLWLAVAGAGLLVAQAARIHPVCWLAAAMLPGVVALSRGRLRRRLRRAALAGLGIGAVVAVTTGPALLAVVTGELGRHWLGQGGGAPVGSPPWWTHLMPALPAVAPLAAAVALVSRRGERGLRAGLLLGVVAVMAATDLLGPVRPAIRAADLALWLPVPLSVGALTLSAQVRRPVAVAALVGVLVAILGVADVLRAPAMLTLPTDVLEGRVVTAWRRALPRGARVIWLSDAGRRVVHLPIYTCGAAGPRAMMIRDDAPGDLPPRLGPDTWYVRDSLCATPEGAPVCARLEAALRRRGARLVPEHAARLPARQSMAGLAYPHRTVDVRLFRLRPAAAPDASRAAPRAPAPPVRTPSP